MCWWCPSSICEVSNIQAICIIIVLSSTWTNKDWNINLQLRHSLRKMGSIGKLDLDGDSNGETDGGGDETAFIGFLRFFASHNTGQDTSKVHPRTVHYPSKPPITVAWTSDVCILQQVSNAGRTEATPSTQTPWKAYKWGPAAGVQMEDQVYRKMEDHSEVFQKISPISKLHGFPFSKKNAVIWWDHFQETCILRWQFL